MRGVRRQWWASGGAAILALAAHVLMLTPLVLGGGVRRRPIPPDMPGGGASALIASAQLADSMTLVDLLHTEPAEAVPLEELASRGIELPQAALIIASPEPTFDPILDEDAIEDSETSEAAGDTQGHARMFGRYLGQISARIERAWRRPRTAIGAARFSCQTKIEQDEQGKVLSIELRRCNGDARWQRSLVSAIDHASPLPAPPTPSVFSRTLVLSFNAEPFEKGFSDPNRYEPGIPRLAAENEIPRATQNGTDEQEAVSALRQHRGAVLLRIEGNTVTWTLQDPQSKPAPPRGSSAASDPVLGEESRETTLRDESRLE